MHVLLVADAILDRFLNGVHRFQLIGNSMRRSIENSIHVKTEKVTDRDHLRYVLPSSEAD